MKSSYNLVTTTADGVVTNHNELDDEFPVGARQIMNILAEEGIELYWNVVDGNWIADTTHVDEEFAGVKYELVRV